MSKKISYWILLFIELIYCYFKLLCLTIEYYYLIIEKEILKIIKEYLHK